MNQPHDIAARLRSMSTFNLVAVAALVAAGCTSGAELGGLASGERSAGSAGASDSTSPDGAGSSGSGGTSDTTMPVGATPTSFRNLTPPAWPAAVTVDVAATIAAPTYSATPEIVYYDYYRNAELAPYRRANTVPIHTPRASEGIVAGDSLRIVARAVYAGLEYPGVSSAAAVVQGAGLASAEPLPQIPYASMAPTIDGGASSYDGASNLTWNGNVMLGPVLDPKGSGRTVNLHRIMEAAPYAWGSTHRCELLAIEDAAYRLPPGVDVWESFAVMRKVGENLPETTSDDAMLVVQSHSPESGDTYPPYSLVVKRQGVDELRWYVSYNTRPVNQWPTYGDVEGERVAHAEPLMPEGVWYRYVLHYRAGYQAAHGAVTEVWRAKPGQAYEHLFKDAGFNAYNGGDGYPRIGPYKWDSNWNGQSSLAFYLTPLHYGRGADLYDRAVASLVGL